MIKLTWSEPQTIADVRDRVQTAIDLEFSTLPIYLYAKMTILPGTNAAAMERYNSIVLEEMIHMCLASNIMNAIGGTVKINPPKFPGPLPGKLIHSKPFDLLPFGHKAVQQGRDIEEPEGRVEPIEKMAFAVEDDAPVTIGQYYALLDAELAKLADDAWQPGRNQIDDAQFFQGQIYAVNNYADAKRAIHDIVSEGEGTPVTPPDPEKDQPANPGSPLDFENQLAHYYRFWEIEKDRVLEKNPGGSPEEQWAWGGPLGVDWEAVYPAIHNPQCRDFKNDPPEAQAAQAECNAAFTGLVDGLTEAFAGGIGGMGKAVRAMFDLRMAAIKALNTPLVDGHSVAGPAFKYIGKGDAA